jgi:radical SAM superfamily enzyme YgiQ (UPF0313 family)
MAQISANLLRDEELVDLIAEAHGKWVFIGMESIDSTNLADVNKSFNKPGEYAAVLKRLAQRNIYAVTSFIIGLDNDTPGVAARTLEQIESWPPGLPVFGQLTPFPSTPLYARLATAGRLTRPQHWLEFAPYQMAHTPLKMTIPQTQAELDQAWNASYSPARNEQALDAIKDESLNIRMIHLVMRLFFRGIYFPQMDWQAWLRVLVQNRRPIFKLTRDALRRRERAPRGLAAPTV